MGTKEEYRLKLLKMLYDREWRMSEADAKKEGIGVHYAFITLKREGILVKENRMDFSFDLSREFNSAESLSDYVDSRQKQNYIIEEFYRYEIISELMEAKGSYE